MFKKFKILLDNTIRTADGEKHYFGTEIEDENGNWDDDKYSIANGFWVIHSGSGKYHDIYR
jgi:hypothetical protein